MVNPAIQNDFSYYRRTLNRMKLSKKDANIKIRDELANRMSLFFAYPTPMMKVLSETTAKFLSTVCLLPPLPRDNDPPASTYSPSLRMLLFHEKT